MRNGRTVSEFNEHSYDPFFAIFRSVRGEQESD